MKKAFLFAMTFTGTFIGAGFATGQEIMSFFVLRNPRGFVFYIISCFLMAYTCRKAVVTGKSNALSLYTGLFGKLVGKLVFFVSVLSLFGCFAASVAGAGSLFNKVFSLNFYEGAFVMTLAAVVICSHGIRGLYLINSILTPFIIVFSVVFGCVSALNPQVQSVMNISFASKEIIIPLWYGILYAGYNVFSLIPVSLGAGENNRLGYIIAFAVTAVSGTVVFLALSVHSETAFLYELPFFDTVSRISAFAEKIYSAVLVFSLVTTASSCLYGFVTGIEALCKIQRRNIYLLCILGIILILPMGFMGIVRKIYPLFGVVGTAVIVRIVAFLRKK